ncbi:FAD-dependent monooxygenase [Streptomyces sp. NPDC050803]|uniref:NAD(P)/FAD-dependent oxidoreductase n=1 Tax=unclassified Streptomyces TaxID=2593676 RepID=UPI0034476603
MVGAGLEGGIIAACLARNGVRVMLLEEGGHPRTRLGETTTFTTQMTLRLIGERYRVPEIKYLASFEGTHSKVCTSGGVKRNISFVHHRPDAPQNPREVHMVVPPPIGFTQNHYFRQDVDNWLLTLAARYGAEVRQQQRITSVATDPDGITVLREGEAPLRAKYLVVTEDERQDWARRLGVEESPARFRTHSRTLDTHMVGVTPFDDAVPKAAYQNPGRFHEGTLTHVFDGGWLSVIPFDNHLRATNQVCGVALHLDPRKHPAAECSPEEEFHRVVSRYPDLARQFAAASPVRDWHRTERRQRSVSRSSGERWSLVGQAAGVVDLLFSGGLSTGLESTQVLLGRLIEAVREDDFSPKRFSDVAELEQGLLDFTDDVCANSYLAFGDFDLWDVAYRMWCVWQILSHYEINSAYTKYRTHRDPAHLAPVDNPWWQGRKLPQDGPYRSALRFLQHANERFQAVEAGDAGPAEVVAELRELLAKADFVPPVFGLGDPEMRYIDPPPHKVPLTLRWTRSTAPEDIGQLTRDGLLPFVRTRFAKGEFEFAEELRNLAAGLPLVGRRFRVPAPE